jgi:hypothetical protein
MARLELTRKRRTTQLALHDLAPTLHAPAALAAKLSEPAVRPMAGACGPPQSSTSRSVPRLGRSNMQTPKKSGDDTAAIEPELLSDEELAHLHELDVYDLPPLGEFDDWMDIATLPPLPDPPDQRRDSDA